VAIASSVGFDTDSNAGTVGCITGVRLGLEAFEDTEDLRRAVADRALVVSADGGECVTDAVLETRRIARSARRLRNDPDRDRRPRFDFDFPGAVQGFTTCPYLGGDATVRQHRFEDRSTALQIDAGSVSTPVFLDPREAVSNFSTLASPTLYPGNTVRAVISSPEGASVQLYAIYDHPAGPRTVEGPATRVGEKVAIDWTVPADDSGIAFRVGLSVTGPVYLHSLDWDGAPEEYSQSGILLSSIWDTQPRGLAPWVSSAKNFEADFATTFSVSHPDPLGVVTTGTRDWVDYEVSSRLTFSLNRAAGLVVRARGHRNFTAAVFDGGTLAIVEQHDSERTVLATTPFALRLDTPYDVTLECSGPIVRARVDGRLVVSATTRRLAGGGAGFFVDTGTMSADGFTVRSQHRAQTRDQKGTTRYDSQRQVEQLPGQHPAGRGIREPGALRGSDRPAS
jgi:hypothetical protein